MQVLNRRYESLFHIDCRRHVHGSRKGIVGRLRHVDVVVGMNWRLAPDRRACKLAARVGDRLVHVHVELCAASRHPDVQRKHVLMLAREDLVTDLNNQLVTLVIEPPACVICIRAPHSLLLGTSTSPRLSVSLRTPVTSTLLMALISFLLSFVFCRMLQSLK